MARQAFLFNGGSLGITGTEADRTHEVPLKSGSNMPHGRLRYKKTGETYSFRNIGGVPQYLHEPAKDVKP